MIKNAILARLNTPLLTPVLPYINQERLFLSHSMVEAATRSLSELCELFRGMTNLNPDYLAALETAQAKWSDFLGAKHAECGLSLAEHDLDAYLGCKDLIEASRQLPKFLHPAVMAKVECLLQDFNCVLDEINKFLVSVLKKSRGALVNAYNRNKRKFIYDCWAMCYVVDPDFFLNELPGLAAVDRMCVTFIHRTKEDVDSPGVVVLDTNFTGKTLFDVLVVSIWGFNQYKKGETSWTVAVSDVQISEKDPAVLDVTLRMYRF